MAADALIFDLDGTVWDSATWFARALSDNDPDLQKAFRDELAGKGNIVRLIQQQGITRERLLRKSIDVSGAPPLFPGMANVLEEAHGRSTPLAIATSLPGSIALPMLEAAGLHRYFSVVIHAGRCRLSKPNPASITMALGELRVRASPAAYYVGDRACDAEAAQRAGISFAWMEHGYEAPPRQCKVVSVRPERLLDL